MQAIHNNQQAINASYYLYLWQHNLNHEIDKSKDNHAIRSELKSKMFELGLELDGLGISMAVQNKIAFLADRKDYYYKNSECTIRAHIEQIINGIIK